MSQSTVEGGGVARTGESCHPLLHLPTRPSKQARARAGLRIRVPCSQGKIRARALFLCENPGHAVLDAVWCLTFAARRCPPDGEWHLPGPCRA